MERRVLESAAAENSYLRGLLLIPLGVLILVAALGNWRVGPLRHDWVFLACVLVLVASHLLITRYYNENYGRVTASAATQRRVAAVAILGAPLLFGTSLLARSRASWSLDLPVNPIAAGLAALMLVSVAVTVGLKTHHLIIWGSVLVAGLLPVWDGADPSNIALVIVGFATIATGLLDHRLLVQTLGPPKHLKLQDGDVGA